MKEKLLCVLEKHCDKLEQQTFNYGAYFLNIDNFKIKLGQHIKTSYNKINKYWFFKSEKEIRIIEYYIILEDVGSCLITKEEYDKIVNLWEETKKLEIIEQLNKLC